MLEVNATVTLGMSEEKQYHHQRTGSGGVDVRIKNYKVGSSSHWNHHHLNSSEDPDIASTQAVKPISNARPHPRAAFKDTRGSDRDSKKAWHGSNHVHNHVTSMACEGKSCDSRSTNGKRRCSRDSEERGEVWMEHVSSSGRTYYYNKQLDKSQWERPEGMLKKAKWETHKSAVSSTPSGHKSAVSSTPSGHKSGVPSNPSGHKSAVSSTPSGHKPGVSSNPSGHKPGVSSTPSGHKSAMSSGHNYTMSSGHKSGVSSTPSTDPPPVKGSGHRDGGRGVGHSRSDGYGRGLKESRDRVKGHESRHHQCKSRSHSGSSSPPERSSGKQHGPSSGWRHVKGTHSTVERSHKTPVHSAASPVSTPKSAIQLISPTTPGNHSTLVTPGTVPSLSQALSSIIDHTSILLERQQRLMATPTSMLITPSVATINSSVVMPGTPPTHHSQPLAKKRLSLTPQIQQVVSPSYSTSPGVQQPVVMVGGALYARGGTMASPHPVVVDSSGLHPLQRALLLQNQQIQQMPHQPGMEHSLQTPPTAIPHHMTPHRSCPGSPILQSPVAVPLGPTTPAYSVPVVQPLTPLQPNMFVMPASTPPNYDPSVTPPQQHLLSSKVLLRPMSKLAYLNNSPELLQFPNTGGLERMGGSRVKQDQVSRELAGLWLEHHEALAKQVEHGRLVTLRRRTVEGFFLSGQLAKKRLALAAKEMKIISTSQRVKHLQALVQELDNLR